MKARAVLVLLLASSALSTHAQTLPDNTRVRILATGLGGGWLDGRLQMNKSSGCTMVALNAVGKLERQDKGAWVEVPVKPLLAKEKKECREAAND